MSSNQYDYNPTERAKLQHRENASAHDIETYADEEKGDCIPFSVSFFPVWNISNSMDIQASLKLKH